MTSTSDAASLVANQTPSRGEASKKKSLRGLLTIYAECRVTSEPESLLASREVTDEEHMLLTYALSLPEDEGRSMYALLDRLETRASAAKPDAVDVSVNDFRTLHAAFNKAPAQLDTPLLGLLDAHRAAATLALCLSPVSILSLIHI